MQRCFYYDGSSSSSKKVFSAHAEMFLPFFMVTMYTYSFLCTCRDVSACWTSIDSSSLFSLHMQRCFWAWSPFRLRQGVFSAHAEMFLPMNRYEPVQMRFLCTCRDVSTTEQTVQRITMFSLHMQRCFQDRTSGHIGQSVFSAHAEMFRTHWAKPPPRPCFLCTCRDVSALNTSIVKGVLFSLHMQRCFRKGPQRHRRCHVFSAHAEMFLPSLLPSRT